MGKSRVPPPARQHGPAKGVGKGPAGGPGWGGEAKGQGNGSPVPPVGKVATEARADPHVRTLAALKRADRETRIAALKDVLLEIAIDGETENGRIAAANALLDREEGKPIARNMNLNRDLSSVTLAEAEAEIARLDALAGRDGTAGMDAHPTPSTLSH